LQTITVVCLCAECSGMGLCAWNGIQAHFSYPGYLDNCDLTAGIAVSAQKLTGVLQTHSCSQHTCTQTPLLMQQCTAQTSEICDVAPQLLHVPSKSTRYEWHAPQCSPKTVVLPQNETMCCPQPKKCWHRSAATSADCYHSRTDTAAPVPRQPIKGQGAAVPLFQTRLPLRLLTSGAAL
jgi:hypothetical protein